jgi:Transglycosylase SLT domain
MAYINPRYIPEDKYATDREERQKQFQALLLATKRSPSQDMTGYRRRFNDITTGGRQATDYESFRRAKRQAAELQAAQDRMSQMGMRQIGVSVGQGQGPDLFGGINVPGAKGNFASFLNAIAGRESGGNYSARNRSSGAMGKYQIMPGNITGSRKGWDYEALGYDVSPGQFMASPKLQEAIARYKLQQYFNRYGAWGAAVAWYAGPGALKYSRNSLNRRQGAYSSISTYANAIVKRMGL